MRGQAIFDAVGLAWYVIFKALYWLLIWAAITNVLGKLLFILSVARGES